MVIKKNQNSNKAMGGGRGDEEAFSSYGSERGCWVVVWFCVQINLVCEVLLEIYRERVSKGGAATVSYSIGAQCSMITPMVSSQINPHSELFAQRTVQPLPTLASTA